MGHLFLSHLHAKRRARWFSVELKRYPNAPWLKVPSSHGVKISSPWPDTWPRTSNIKTHDLGKQEHKEDRQVFVSFTLLSLTVSISAFTSVLLPPLLSFAFYSATYLEKPHWWLKWDWITHSGLIFPTEKYGRFHTDKLQNKLRTKEGFILALLIHETDIYQHAKFRPKQGLLLHLLCLCSFLGNSCDPMPIAEPKRSPTLK